MNAGAPESRRGCSSRCSTARGASSSRQRHVVAKATYLEKEENVRYVVTSLREKEWEARTLYEQPYCARGEMENASRNSRLCSETI